MTGIGENTLAQPVKPPLRERCACLAKLVKNRLTLTALGIERSLSAKGCPYDNAVDESTNRILKAELVHRETFGTTRELRAKLSDYVHRYNNFRIHSTLGYMPPVGFREAGLSLPESSK